VTAFVDHAPTQSVPAHPTPWAGLTVVAVGVVAFACLSVGPELRVGGPGNSSVYTSSQWLLAGAVCLSGLLAAFGSRGLSNLSFATAAVTCAQLAGAGAVAYKHWVPWSGMTGVGLIHPDELRWIGIALAVTCSVAVLVCLQALVARGAFGVSMARPLARVVTVGTGIVIIGLVPLALAGGQPDRLDWESLGAFSLLYGLPWGVGVAVSAWLTRPAALGVHGAVFFSALVSSRTDAMMSTADQSIAFGFSALAAACAAVARYSDHAK
jgi:hypothetical protein